jgi:translation elongation factor P/translation initiation factor 5A
MIISCQSKNEEKKALVVAKPLNEVKIEKNKDSLIYKIDENTIVMDNDTLQLESPFIYSFEGKINGNKKIQLHLSNRLSTEYGGYLKTASIYIDGEDDILDCYFEKDKKHDYYTATINDYDNDNKIICKLKLYNLSSEKMYIEYILDKKSYKIYPSRKFPSYKCFDEINYTLFDSRVAFRKEEAMRKFTPSRDYNFLAEIISDDVSFDVLKTKLKYLFTDSLSTKNYKKWKHSFNVEKSKGEDDNYSSENLAVVAPVFMDSNIYVVSDFSYSYMGGAHGIMHTEYNNYDLSTGKKINIEQLVNFSDENFITFYENKVKSEYEEGILSKEIPITQNFYILPTGIIFSYAPYELLGFAAGEPHVFCSYEELKPFILKNTILDQYNSN